MPTLSTSLLSRIFVALLAYFCGFNGQATASPSSAGEYEIKAGFIYNFAKFVDWPAATGSEVRLCVFGRDPFGPILDAMRNQPVKERRLDVARIDSLTRINECQMVYISATLDKHLEKIVETTRAKGILLISDSEGFAQRGVMINLYLDEGRVRFEINFPAIQAGGLLVSSKLLALGKLIK